MTDIPHNRKTDIVDDAARALREAPVPPGPSEQALARALSAAQATDRSRGGPGLKERITSMSRWQRAVAAALIVAVGGGLGYILLAGSGTAVAFADVRAQILAIRTVSWKMQVQMPNQQAMAVQIYATDRGQMRQEMAGGMVVIFDITKGESLTLVPKAKKAILTKMLNVPESVTKQGDHLGRLKKMIQGAEEKLGEKDIDGRKATGYRVRVPDQVMDVWVTPDTGNPVLIECDVGGGGPTIRMTDFVIDPELDEKLFDLTPPEGYTVEEKTVDFEVDEEDLTKGLGLLAKYNGGVFPAGGMPMLSPKIIKNMQAAKIPEDEGKAFGEAYQKVVIFYAMKGSAAEELKYFGGGVKLGDGDRAIMWWREKGAKTYRVLYGDLKLKDVVPSDLPTTRPADEAGEAEGGPPASR